MDRQLTDGSPVPDDDSHREINPATGMQKGYVVLSPEERAKGFVKPLRYAYIHTKCGVVTTMGGSLSETYARNPRFYSGTYCVGCRTHFPLNEFSWDEDGEPMDPDLQDEWASKQGERDTARKEKLISIKNYRVNQLYKEIADLNTEIMKLRE